MKKILTPAISLLMWTACSDTTTSQLPDLGDIGLQIDDMEALDTRSDMGSDACLADERAGPDGCVPCSMGRQNEAGDDPTGPETSCDPISCDVDTRVEDNACVPCPPGTQNEAGDDASAQDTQCDAILCAENERVTVNTCAACTPGSVSDPGADASGSDTECDVVVCGEDERVTSNTCESCNPGSVNDAGDDASGPDTMCDAILCMEDERVASNRCVACPPGSRNMAGDDASGPDTMCDAQRCPSNTFVSSNQCISCPPGATRPAGDDATGEDTICDVTLCQENERVENFLCIACEVGSANAPGDPTTEERTQCDPIACATNEYVSSNQCISCDPGKVRDAGDLATGADTACTTPIVGLSLSQDSTCAVTTLGGVKCWGFADYGQLGNGGVVSTHIPSDVTGLTSGVNEVQMGEYHACAKTQVGELWCWGRNRLGELGNNTTTNQRTPVKVQGLPAAIDNFALGQRHTCAALTNGQTWCWGNNIDGQIGVGLQGNSYRTPQHVTSLTGAQSIVSGGEFHTCSVEQATGTVSCWGRNNQGQLGLGMNTSVENLPTATAPLGGRVSALSAGYYGTLYLLETGQIKAAGSGTSGQLGTGSAQPSPTPTSAYTIPNETFVMMDINETHSCAVAASGALYCVGNGSGGRLGDGTTRSRSAPVRIGANVPNWAGVSVGLQHSCAWTQTGRVWCWGRNNHGQVGVAGADQLVPVEVTIP